MARHFPPLQYRNLLTLKGLHRSPLVALAFNLKGTLLATADSGAVEDGTWRSHLVVWEMASTHGLRQYRFAVKCSYGLAALIWAEDIGIIVAGQDGSITVVQESFVQRKVHVLTFDAHVSAVSSIAFNAVTRLVATAATDGLKVWKENRKWSLQRHLHHSSSRLIVPSQNRAPFTVTGLNWESDKNLVVSYVEHPVVIWDVTTSQCLREIPLLDNGPGPSLGVFSKELFISYNNQMFNIYDLTKSVLSFSFQHSSVFPLPAIFVHDGHAVFHGSENGGVHLRDCQKTSTWRPDPVVTLKHNSPWPITALAAFSEASADTFLVAAGNSPPSEEHAPSIDVWKSFPRDIAPAGKGIASSKHTAHAKSYAPVALRRSMLIVACFLFVITAFLLK